MSRADVVALSSIAVVVILAVAATALLSTQAGQTKPCGRSGCVAVNGLNYATIGPFILQHGPPLVNCTGPAEISVGWSLTWGSVNITVTGWWNCAALQNVTVLGREANGIHYSDVLTSPTIPGRNETWISPDRQFGVEVFGPPYGPMVSVLVQVA